MPRATLVEMEQDSTVTRTSYRPLECAVALYASGAGAVEGIRALLRSGWDIDAISVVGKDSSNPEHVIGLYTSGTRKKFWATQAESWNALSDELRDCSLFIAPKLGPIIVIGPLVDGFVATLTSIQGPHASGVVAAALSRAGIPAERAAHYEAALESGRIVVAAAADPHRVSRAREILDETRPTELEAYPAWSLRAG